MKCACLIPCQIEIQIRCISNVHVTESLDYEQNESTFFPEPIFIWFIFLAYIYICLCLYVLYIYIYRII